MRYIFLIITTLLLACNNKMDENKNKIYQDPIEIDAIKLRFFRRSKNKLE